MAFVLTTPRMDPHQPALHLAHPVLHTLPPSMPIVDDEDVQFRAANLRASMRACPECWRGYFETMAKLMRVEVH